MYGTMPFYRAAKAAAQIAYRNAYPSAYGPARLIERAYRVNGTYTPLVGHFTALLPLSTSLRIHDARQTRQKTCGAAHGAS